MSDCLKFVLGENLLSFAQRKIYRGPEFLLPSYISFILFKGAQ